MWPYGRGVIALRRDPENALPFLRKAAELADDANPGYQSAMRLQLAEALLERHEVGEADRLFREERRRDPGSLRAALGLGLIARDRGDDQAAVDFLTAARDSPCARKTASTQLAALAYGRGDKAGAAEYEKKASALLDDAPWPDPFADEVARRQVGQQAREREAAQFERQERFADAARVYLTQLEKQPSARACVGAGINLTRIGDYDRGLPLLRRGVQLGPDSSQAHYALAMALFVRAKKEWQHAPDSPPVKEQFREAVEHAERAAELQPDHARAYLVWGLTLKYLGQPAAAVTPLRKGVTCLPVDFDLQLGLGEALLETGQLKEAETHLENARKLNARDDRLAEAIERLRKKKGG